jgi:hypothetical protein
MTIHISAAITQVSRRVAALVTVLFVMANGLWFALPGDSGDSDSSTMAQICTDLMCPMHHPTGQYCPAHQGEDQPCICQMSSSGQRAISIVSSEPGIPENATAIVVTLEFSRMFVTVLHPPVNIISNPPSPPPEA